MCRTACWGYRVTPPGLSPHSPHSGPPLPGVPYCSRRPPPKPSPHFCWAVFPPRRPSFLPRPASSPSEPPTGPSSYWMAFLTTPDVSGPYLGAIVNAVLFHCLSCTHMVHELLPQCVIKSPESPLKNWCGLCRENLCGQGGVVTRVEVMSNLASLIPAAMGVNAGATL